MLKRYLTIAVLLTYSGVSYALDDTAKERLHNVSVNIEKKVDHEYVVESLYQQIRPRANITNTSLSEQQVDDKVRQYIADKYMPVLIMNYQHIYTQLHDNSGVFSNCDKVTAIKPGEDVLKALCLKEDNNQIKLSYMKNGYSQGWNTSMTLVFNTIEEEYVLTSIELHLKNGVKAYVEGI